MHLDIFLVCVGSGASVQIVKTGVQDALVRDKAAAEVVLEGGSNEEGDDPGSPWEADSVAVAIRAVVVEIVVVDHQDDHLDELEDNKDQGADEEELDEAVHPERLLLVNTSKSICRDESDQEVQDTNNDHDGTIGASVAASNKESQSTVAVEDKHDGCDNHGSGVQWEAKTAVLKLGHLSGEATAVALGDNGNLGGHILGGVHDWLLNNVVLLHRLSVVWLLLHRLWGLGIVGLLQGRWLLIVLIGRRLGVLHAGCSGLWLLILVDGHSSDRDWA